MYAHAMTVPVVVPHQQMDEDMSTLLFLYRAMNTWNSLKY